jgi:hypothetical protein
MVMNAEAKGQAKKKQEGSEEGAVTMESLAPMLRYDFALVEALLGDAGRFKDVAEERERVVLLLGGELSPGYIRVAMRTLQTVVGNDKRNVRWVEVKGVGHELLENKIRNGKVEMAIEILREFLHGGTIIST